MDNHFFAILDDDNNSVRRVELSKALTEDVRKIFLDAGEALLNENIEQYEFDGNYKPESDEILFVELDQLPPAIEDISRSILAVRVLDFAKETIKALFWYEEKTDTYYFQNFDSRKRLDKKFVLFQDKKTYSRLDENAFIIEESVQGVYVDKKFYFRSFANANKIINLGSFFKAATEEDIRSFAENPKLSFDPEWLVKQSTSTIKTLIAKVTKKGILSDYETSAIQTSAKDSGLEMEIDETGKILLPEDIKKCRAILTFLHEGRFPGPITKTIYETNSQRTVKPAK